MDKIVIKYTSKDPESGKTTTGQTRADDIPEAKQAVENLLYHSTTMRIVIDGGEKPVKVAPKPVKVQSLEWVQKEHPRGEKWEGLIDGKMVADVFHYTWESGIPPNYSLHLGPFGPKYQNVASVEAGKRAAQAAFNKAVRSMLAK